MTILLNERAWEIADQIAAHSERLRVTVLHASVGTRIIDCGVKAQGGLEAGRSLAEACLSTLGRVEIAPCSTFENAPVVTIATDQPALACLASQYAGWQLTGERYFAMGSGPMRAVAAKEDILRDLKYRETPSRVVGILETGKHPPDEVCQQIATACGVSGEQVTLLVARTASLAGSVQVVARSVETALHKLHALNFDVTQIRSAFGSAPLPPIAVDDLSGIGWTNDAILYGGDVTLWVAGEDDELQNVGKQVPSSSSTDFGDPFAAIFKRAGNDFYKIDAHLFSPARVTFVNLNTGRTFRFGQLRPDILKTSYGW